MKITIERNHLTHALGNAGRAISNRNTLPILSNVLLETGDDSVKITGHDLDTSIYQTVPAYVKANGSCTIPHSILFGIVQKSPEGPVQLELENGKVKVKCGHHESNLLTAPAEDYPVIPEVNDGCELTIPQGELRTMLKRVVRHTMNEKFREIMTGVLFEITPKHLTLVATDKSRFSMTRHTLEDATPARVTIPGKACANLMQLLKDSAEQTVTLRVDGPLVQFQTQEGVTIITRVLDGDYVQYAKYFPKPEQHLRLSRAELLSALERMKLFAPDALDFKTYFNICGSGLTIKAQQATSGFGQEEIAAPWHWDEMNFAVNAVVFCDLLDTVESDEIVLGLSDKAPSILITAPDVADWKGMIGKMAI